MDDDIRFVYPADHGQHLFPLTIELFQIMVQYGPIALILERVLRPEMLDFQDIRHANPLPERLNLHTDIHVIQMETLKGAIVKPDGSKHFPGDEKTHAIDRDDIRDMVMEELSMIVLLDNSLIVVDGILGDERGRPPVHGRTGQEVRADDTDNSDRLIGKKIFYRTSPTGGVEKDVLMAEAEDFPFRTTHPFIVGGKYRIVMVGIVNDHQFIFRADGFGDTSLQGLWDILIPGADND